MKNHSHKNKKQPGNGEVGHHLRLLFLDSASESGLGDFLHQSLKFGRSSYRQVGKDLAVETDIGLLQTVHKGTVVDVQRAAGGVDTNDPQLTILLFFLLASAKKSSMPS